MKIDSPSSITSREASIRLEWISTRILPGVAVLLLSIPLCQWADSNLPNGIVPAYIIYMMIVIVLWSMYMAVQYAFVGIAQTWKNKTHACKYQFTWDDFVKISFSHHIEILTRSKDIAERLFYIHCAAQNAWSLSSLKNYLKEDIYSNRGSLPSNFLQVLPEAIYAVKATLAFKDEYMLEMVNLENVGEREQDWNEKVIENQIVTNIKQFILRFGNDFTFIDSQHRLIVAGEEMFADLVFFNRELNASVIVELKRGKFRPNYLGQLSGYLTVYDMTDKKPHENPSIGIVLCQDANRQFVEIMVRDYDKPMGVATYRTAQEMPENLRKTLPDIDKLQNLLSENDSKSETVR